MQIVAARFLLDGNQELQAGPARHHRLVLHAREVVVIGQSVLFGLGLGVGAQVRFGLRGRGERQNKNDQNWHVS